MLAVIAVATVAAIAVIAYHAPGPTELLAKPHSFTKNGDCPNVQTAYPMSRDILFTSPRTVVGFMRKLRTAGDTAL